MKLFAPSLVLAACFLVGCAKPGDDELQESKKPVVQFEGTIDKALVGTWKAETAEQTYIFLEDGSFKMDQVIKIPKGDPMKTHTEGEWRRKDQQVIIKDAQKNVVPYACKLEGDAMELSLTGTMKITTKLKRIADAK